MVSQSEMLESSKILLHINSAFAIMVSRSYHETSSFRGDKIILLKGGKAL